MSETTQRHITLTNDDISWIAERLKLSYNSVNSSGLSDAHKNRKISGLVSRAYRFGLHDLVHEMGWVIIVIPLDRDREAKLLIPQNITDDDRQLIMQQLEMRASSLADKPNN